MLHRLPLIRVRVERGRQRRPLSRLIIFQWWLLALIGSRLIVPPRSNCSASSSGRVTAIENGRPARSARSGIQDRSKEAAAEYARFRFHVERLALGNWVCSYAEFQRDRVPRILLAKVFFGSLVATTNRS